MARGCVRAKWRYYSQRLRQRVPAGPVIRGGLVAQEQPLYAAFCTLRICHDPWGTAGHTATTAHHLYWIYNLVYISPI